uniref:ATPase AAA-type core domain-containing protein n=1 Tax=Chromulina nebulosa TaxID=96789 RepID=A0A7S0SRD8_9STRA|mmetsp:Transcript_2287/g.2048  ORF Transcript_2287/g.2048 Transcript_2287/m.2048 type:complete len:415 (+) Transcript_2287:100-1344(+)
MSHLNSLLSRKLSFNIGRSFHKTSYLGNRKFNSMRQIICQRWNNFSQTNKIGVGVTILITSLFTSAVWLVANYSQSKEVIYDIQEILLKSLQSNKITSSLSKENYVRRQDVEASVNLATNVKYMVVYGPKGAGKSELVEHCAINKNGVIRIVVTSANTKQDIVSQILKNAAVGIWQKDDTLESTKLIEAVQKSEFMLTFIFDVERGGTADQALGIQAVRSLCKLLAPYCKCIIVFSEANAVLEFGLDKSREKFLFVSEMNHAEAIQLLKNHGCTLTDNEMISIIFNTIGTIPSFLISLMMECGSDVNCLKRECERTVADAEQDLIAFPHKPILKAIKDHPELTGIHPKYFNNSKNEGVDLSSPKDVGVAMKRSNAILYRLELGEYQLMSTAHKTALKSYNPIWNPVDDLSVKKT